jgi:hypothetical protein
MTDMISNKEAKIRKIVGTSLLGLTAGLFACYGGDMSAWSLTALVGGGAGVLRTGLEKQ